MFGAALVFEAGPLPDRASPLMHQSHVVSVVWVMSGGLPVFGIAGLANIEKRSLPHEFAARTVDQSWSRSPSTAIITDYPTLLRRVMAQLAMPLPPPYQPR
jgi:hypothetical protein